MGNDSQVPVKVFLRKTMEEELEAEQRKRAQIMSFY